MAANEASRRSPAVLPTNLGQKRPGGAEVGEQRLAVGRGELGAGVEVLAGVFDRLNSITDADDHDTVIDDLDAGSPGLDGHGAHARETP